MIQPPKTATLPHSPLPIVELNLGTEAFTCCSSSPSRALVICGRQRRGMRGEWFEEEEVAEEDHFCRKRKFTLEEEDEEAKGETLELKTLPLKKRVRFNLNSLFRKNLEDFVNEKKMEELENGMKQL